MPRSWIVAFCTDDAFYYFTIARNVVQGNGCTFDGIAPTNGFHPLYMLISIAVFRLFDSDPDWPVRALLAINVLCLLVSVRIAVGLTERWFAPGWGWLAALLFLFPPLFGALTNGMETGLMVMAVCVLMHLCARYGIHKPDSGLIGGMALGCAISVVTLARLDSAFLLPAALVCSVWMGLRNRGSLVRVLRHAGAAIMGFLPLFGAFVLWNVLQFGMIMPISGKVKSGLPSLAAAFVLDDHKSLGLLMVLAIIICLAFDFWLYRRVGGLSFPLLRDSPVPLLALACVLHYMYVALCVRWGAYWWHFTSYGLVLALLVPRVAYLIAAVLPRARRLSMPLAGLVFGGCICANVLRIAQLSEKHASWLEAAQWIREQVPQNAVIAMKDAGLVGYYSGRQVINLDGKANGLAYWDSVERGRPDQYLNAHGVAYIAEVSARYHGDIAFLRIPRPDQPSLLYQMRRDAEVYEGRPHSSVLQGLGLSVPGHLVIWRYDGVLQIGT